jgi:hypothetical protein
MKTRLLLLFIALIANASCRRELQSTIVGTWEPVSIKWEFLDSTKVEYPGNVTKCQALWIITDKDNSYSVNYQIPPDTTYSLDFCSGPYDYDGKIFKETRIFSTDKSLVNQSFTWNLRLINDTIFIDGPAENEIQRLGCRVKEVWSRK